MGREAARMVRERAACARRPARRGRRCRLLSPPRESRSGYDSWAQARAGARRHRLSRNMFVKRTIVAIAAAIAAVTLAHAQSYPAKAVKIVSPFAPGGPRDLLPRAVAARLSPLLPPPVIVPKP